MRRVAYPEPYPWPVVSRGCASALVALLPVAVLLTGCGRSVAVQPLPMGSDASKAACAALTEALPGTLSAGRSWRVEPDANSTAAWGTPPVVLRCGDGVPAPEPTDQLLRVDGLTWVVEALTDGEEYRTVDRAPGVVVTIPDTYAPTSAVLAELAPTVGASTEPIGQG